MLDWIGIAASLVLFAGYELGLRRRAQLQPERVARLAHARLRAQWVEALAKQPGTELLGVQTLRNSLMSATIIASTWALSLMGTVALIGRAPIPETFTAGLTPRVVVTVLLLATIFASVLVSLVAIRFFNHAGYMISLPVGSAARTNVTPDTVEYMRRAGYFYSLSVRSFFAVAPLVVGTLSPALMALPAAGMLVALAAFDKVPRAPTGIV